MTGRTCIIFAVPKDISEIPSWDISPRKNIRRHLKLYSILAVVHRLLQFFSMKILLLPPEVLSVAALILSFVARLTDEDWSLSPSARHSPATVRSLMTKTFVILDSPNEVLLSPEILLHHDQIFSFLSDSLKSILDHYKGARKTSIAWIHSEKCTKGRLHKFKIKRVVLWEDQLKEKVRLELWKTTSGKRNTEAKTTALGRHFLFTQISMRR